jgi:hypothetical protein
VSRSVNIFSVSVTECRCAEHRHRPNGDVLVGGSFDSPTSFGGAVINPAASPGRFSELRVACAVTLSQAQKQL